MNDLRELLIAKRQEIFTRRRRLEDDWQNLGEREIELEEEAQKASLSHLYEQLSKRGKEEIEENDLALVKMASGRYGICEGCARDISRERLESLPATRLCKHCAKKFEKRHQTLPSAGKLLAGAPQPAQFRDLDDDEIRESITEFLCDDGRVDLQELEITCHTGIVTLEGFVPSKREHGILMRTLADVLGFTTIIDQVRIREVSWEKEEHPPEARANEEDERPDPEVDTFSEDVFEAQEEDSLYTFPDRPPAETE